LHVKLRAGSNFDLKPESEAEVLELFMSEGSPQISEEVVLKY
jgi:hypothetical protein